MGVMARVSTLFLIFALLGSGAFAGGAAKTKAVLLKLDIDLKDEALEFLLDGRELTAKALQDPLSLKFGRHELVVLHDDDPVAIHHFEVGPATPAELQLKRETPPPGDDGDFPINLASKPTVWPAPGRYEQ